MGIRSAEESLYYFVDCDLIAIFTGEGHCLPGVIRSHVVSI